VEYHNLAVVVKRLGGNFHLLTIIVDFHRQLKRKVHLNVLVKTSNVTLVVPRSDETDLGSSLGRVAVNLTKYK
jgi:hypothetical protein